MPKRKQSRRQTNRIERFWNIEIDGLSKLTTIEMGISDCDNTKKEIQMSVPMQKFSSRLN